jgi:hypothetical protein
MHDNALTKCKEKGKCCDDEAGNYETSTLQIEKCILLSSF